LNVDIDPFSEIANDHNNALVIIHQHGFTFHKMNPPLAKRTSSNYKIQRSMVGPMPWKKKLGNYDIIEILGCR
jgi:hypothetical protein